MSVNSFKSGEVPHDLDPNAKKKKKKSKSTAAEPADDADNADSSPPTDLNHISMQLAQLISGVSHLEARIDGVEAHVGSPMHAGGKPSDGCGLPEAPPKSGNPDRAAPTNPADHEEARHVRTERVRGGSSNANANFARAQPFSAASPNVQAAQPFPFDIGHFAEDNPFPRPRAAEGQVYAYNLRDDGASADLVEGLRRVRSGQAIFEVRNLVPMLSYMHDLSTFADECAALTDDPETAARFAHLRNGIDSVYEFGHERLDEVQIRNEEPKATGLHEWIASRYDIDNRARSSRFVRRAREAHDSAVLGQVVKQGAATEGARVLHTHGATSAPKPPAGAHGADESDDEANAGRDKGKGKGKRAQRATRQH